MVAPPPTPSPHGITCFVGAFGRVFINRWINLANPPTIKFVMEETKKARAAVNQPLVGVSIVANEIRVPPQETRDALRGMIKEMNGLYSSVYFAIETEGPMATMMRTIAGALVFLAGARAGNVKYVKSTDEAMRLACAEARLPADEIILAAQSRGLIK